ncbi:hypothetical protein GX563_07840 [Candidatus Bathyarchaeota archaeon]|nr:hypothetical protein [Candidatus Bathyarchaeota archaeon]
MYNVKRPFGILAVLVLVFAGIATLQEAPTDAQTAANQSTIALKTIINEKFPVPYATAHHIISLPLEKNDRLEGSFTVDKFYTYPNLNYGGHGESVTVKVVVMILDQNGQTVYKCYPARIGSFNITAAQSGVYTFATGCYYLWLINRIVNPEMTLNYTVTGLPFKINILSPSNDIYTPNVSLSFTVNRFSDWIDYRLDGNSSVPLWDGNWSYYATGVVANYRNITTPVSYGNTTLTGLTSGLHTLTLSANDTYGNWDNQTISFRVDPSLATKGIDAVLFPALIAVVIIVALALIVSVVLYRKHLQTCR